MLTGWRCLSKEDDSLSLLILMDNDVGWVHECVIHTIASFSGGKAKKKKTTPTLAEFKYRLP
jgi:hypothetical protein